MSIAKLNIETHVKFTVRHNILKTLWLKTRELYSRINYRSVLCLILPSLAEYGSGIFGYLPCCHVDQYDSDIEPILWHFTCAKCMAVPKGRQGWPPIQHISCASLKLGSLSVTFRKAFFFYQTMQDVWEMLNFSLPCCRSCGVSSPMF